MSTPPKRRRGLEGWPELPAEPPLFADGADAWALEPDRTLTIVLLNKPDELVAFFREHFGVMPRVVIRNGNVEDLHAAREVDCFLSSANSYGNMDGGIDRTYAELLGWSYGEPYHDANPLQLAIAERARIETGDDTNEGWGLFEVGKAILVREDPVSLIAAPTMQIPGALPKDTRNVCVLAPCSHCAPTVTNGLVVVNIFQN
jgi:hypothetical protein